MASKNDKPWQAKLCGFSTAALRLLPAELAHNLTMQLLETGLGFSLFPGAHNASPRWDFDVDLHTELPGIGALAHPIGLAAGLDKNARALSAWPRLGFSFCEIGTLTPKAQAGNPLPRLFRLPSRRGIINRMGFNNDGVDIVAQRLETSRIKVGINLGKNKITATEDALQDYAAGLEATERYGQYFVVNISSPNTPGLRALANPVFLRELGTIFAKVRHKTWVKLDPDAPKDVFQKNIEAIAAAEFAGVILSNTHRVEWPQSGGLSGHALLPLANACLEWAFEVHRGVLPMIGVGGILDGADVVQKVLRGASAVQIYTALIYRGPWVVWELLREMAEELKLRGFHSLREAKGAYYQHG